jgi:hypothetical protein
MKLQGMIVTCTICCLFVLCAPAAPVRAGTDPSILANAISAPLDLWRESWIAQLYDRLGNYGNTTKEQFVEILRGTTIRPACCWQKIENFKVLIDNGTEATVSAKIGMEVTDFIFDENSNSIKSTCTTVEYITREFKLNNEGGLWKMQLNDVFNLRNAAMEGKSQRYPGNCQ